MPDNENDIANTIDDAEEVPDPLDGLVERTKTDPGAPFTSETLEALAALKKNDRAAFEKLRAELKNAGCRVTELDKALAEASGEADDGRDKRSQADILLDIAQEAELFHTADNTSYADLDVKGHRETWLVRTQGFRLWLARRYYEEEDGAPSSEALQSALNVIEAKARFDGPERSVYVRVGSADERIYLDLCNETWQAVEIDSTGWRVIDTPPIRFYRAKGMLPLPLPVRGGSVDDLRPYLNVQSDAEFVLIVSSILAALRDCGPYPPVALAGEQGSAKSTFARIIQMLIDPNTMLLRTPPKDERDMFIAAINRHLISIDNLSYIAEWLSDTFCRLSTGGGFGTRQLYTDQDEILLDVIKPLILNGIEDIVNRPDLADRTIFLTLKPIPDDKRRPESELLAALAADRPRILGALLDAMVTGLKRLPGIKLEKLPRMADFAIWASACETTFWKPGTFMEAYTANIDGMIETVINANPLADAVRKFMATQTSWSGSATDLLELLGRVVGEKATRAKTWPVDAARLGGKLRRAATFLRKAGIEIDLDQQQGHDRTRTITITTIQINAPSTQPSASPATSTQPPPPPPAAPVKPGFLSEERVREMAKNFLDAVFKELEETGDVDRAAIDQQLRDTLVSMGVPKDLVDTEMDRIIEATSTALN